MAAMLLEPIRAQHLTQEHADGLAAVTGRYGEDWTRNVIDGWYGQARRSHTELSDWVDNDVGKLCGTLRDTGHREVARLLAAGAWQWMSSELQLLTDFPRSDFRQPQLEMVSSPLVSLLETADETLRDEITAALREFGDNVLESLMPALRLAQTRQSAELDMIARDCAGRLRAILARAPREKNARHKAEADLAWLTSAH